MRELENKVSFINGVIVALWFALGSIAGFYLGNAKIVDPAIADLDSRLTAIELVLGEVE